MWMMTKYGFFSVVEFRGEPHNLLIRARRRDHLEAIKKRFAQQLTGYEILQTSEADYPCRMKVPRRTWESIVCEIIAHEIDYPDFKSAVKNPGTRTYNPGLASYLNFLHRVWSLGHGMEDPRK